MYRGGVRTMKRQTDIKCVWRCMHPIVPKKRSIVHHSRDRPDDCVCLRNKSSKEVIIS